MKIGAHVSAAGGVENAPANARELNLDTFQIFSRPPQGGAAPVIDDKVIANFKKAMADNGFTDFVIHAPYFTNFGSAEARVYKGTVSVLKQELERGTLLGAAYLMFHPGSFRDVGEKRGMKQVCEGISEVLEGYKGTTQLLVENSAGAGSVACDSFEELSQVLEYNKLFLGKTLGGVCFDTQHAFSSGYDLQGEEAVAKTLNDFDKSVGLKNLKMLHVNDSVTTLGGKRDRHDHIGEGQIGLAGFEAIAARLKQQKVGIPWILETKHDKISEDVKKLRTLQKGMS